ncbi:MAG TPA: hypothetical protein VF469_15470 [Kofleriaceae bacterium]
MASRQELRIAPREVQRDHAPGMRVLHAIGLMLLFAVGAVLGLAIGLVIVPVSWLRAARAVHADGVVCRAELVATDPCAAHLAGPALVRLSGALEPQTAGSDVLGLCIRMQRTASDDAAQGDQDLLLGSFESFHTVGRDRARTDAGDYLANCYSTVTPWWLTGYGPVILRLFPPPAAPATRGSDRLARLDADLADGRARLGFAVTTPAGQATLAELRLLERLAIDGRALRASMFRQGRGLRPLGLRNGIRATVYPMGQLARRLRGG